MMKKPLGVTISATTNARPPASHSHIPYAPDYKRIRQSAWSKLFNMTYDKIEGFMPLILVTNDDGVTSEGIHALADAMKPLGDVLSSRRCRKRARLAMR